MRPRELPAALAHTYRLGSLCARNHNWRGTGQSLRKRSNGGCLACFRLTEDKRHRPRDGTRPGLPQIGDRPELPAWMATNCFLSPVLCENAAHRYKGQQWTLRFQGSEACTMCVAQTRPVAGE